MFPTNLFYIFNCVFVPTFDNTLEYLRLLLAFAFGQHWKRICSLGKILLQCSRIRFIFTKIMNKLISTKNRIVITLVGPSDSGKTYLFHEWLKVGAFQPKLDKIYFFSINTLNHSMISCEKKLIIMSLFKVCTLNLSTL